MKTDLSKAIKAAMKEPKAPQSLVEKTVAMAVAMEKSRAKAAPAGVKSKNSGLVL